MDNIYVASGTTAIFVSVAMQILKNTPFFPWLSRNSGKVNAWLGFLVAFASSIGIAFSFDFNSASGDFIGKFHGNLWDVLHLAGHTAVQWAMQHGFYKAAIVPAETLGEIRSLLARAMPPAVSDGMQKAVDIRKDV